MSTQTERGEAKRAALASPLPLVWGRFASEELGWVHTLVDERLYLGHH